jgi:two-component system OmpR family response regulator
MRILIISPFAAERIALEELLRCEGHHVTSVASRGDGLIAATSDCPPVIIADAQVPGLDGLSLVRELRARGSPSRVILLCPRAGCGVEKKHGIVCLTKPIDLGELHRQIAPRPEARVA